MINKILNDVDERLTLSDHEQMIFNNYYIYANNINETELKEIKKELENIKNIIEELENI